MPISPAITRYKAELSNAVDSAALALARRGEDYTDSEATAFVKNYLSGFAVEDSEFTITNVNVTKTDNGFQVSRRRKHAHDLPSDRQVHRGRRERQ